MNERLSPKNAISKAAPVFALSLLLNGCFSSEATPDKSYVAESYNTEGSLNDLVFDGRITDREGSDWSVNCYGPTTKITAEIGDTLLKLANESDMIMLDNPNLNGKSVPAEVYSAALGELNNISDYDSIYPGQSYIFPERCEA